MGRFPGSQPPLSVDAAPIQDQECPLCRTIPGKSRSHFVKHLAGHLESIALVVLPQDSGEEWDQYSDVSEDYQFGRDSVFCQEQSHANPEGSTQDNNHSTKIKKATDDAFQTIPYVTDVISPDSQWLNSVEASLIPADLLPRSNGRLREHKEYSSVHKGDTSQRAVVKHGNPATSGTILPGNKVHSPSLPMFLHERVEDSSGRFKCSCNKVFKGEKKKPARNNLQRHIEEKNNSKRWACIYRDRGCEHRGARKSNARQHMKKCRVGRGGEAGSTHWQPGGFEPIVTWQR